MCKCQKIKFNKDDVREELRDLSKGVVRGEGLGRK